MIVIGVLTLIACGSGKDFGNSSDKAEAPKSDGEEIVIRASNYKSEKEITGLVLDKLAKK